MTTDKPRRRTFTVDRPRDGSVEFDLVYQVKNLPDNATDADRDAWDESAEDAWLPGKSTIRCIPRIPGQVLLDFISSEGTENFGAIDQFLSTAVVKSDRAEYRRVVTDPDIAVPIETLGEVVGWLVEVYSARPTAPPSD